MTKKQRIVYIILNIFLIAAYFLIGYYSGFFIRQTKYVWISAIIIASALTLCLIGYAKNMSSLLKLEIIILLCSILTEFIFYFIIKYNLFEKFNTVEKMKSFILQYNGISALIFIAIQFLQVTIVPIPSAITTLAGSLIFGYWQAFFYSVVGIVLGSMFAFFLGRIFGTKLAVWIFGEKLFEKYQNTLKGKDKFLMYMMFLLPFFPDDLICILAGLTDMTYRNFFLMMIITRPIGIATVSGAFNGLISIPFVGWGILFWIVLAFVLIAMIILILKYGEILQDKFILFFTKIKIKFTKNKSTSENNSNSRGVVQNTKKSKTAAVQTNLNQPIKYLDVLYDDNFIGAKNTTKESYSLKKIEEIEELKAKIKEKTETKIDGTHPTTNSEKNMAKYTTKNYQSK